MAEKHRLRLNRAGTVINLTSRQQESNLGKALTRVLVRIAENFDVEVQHQKKWTLDQVVKHLGENFPEIDFFEPHKNTFMSPDGGILSIRKKGSDDLFPILISEVKRLFRNDGA